MRIVICEDESYYQEAICDVINSWMTTTNRQDVSYVCFHSTEDLLERWENGLAMDLLFLDIQIPGEMDGMSLARKVRSKDANVFIVFVTNFANYVYDGYVVNALRYLKKPIQKEQIWDCLEIVYQRFSLLSQESIVVNAREQRFVLKYSDLIYMETQSHYLQLHLANLDEAMEVRTRLRDFAAQLPQNLFVQCHRGCIVNLEHIRRFSKTTLTMSNRHIVPISQTYFLPLERAFNEYFSDISGIRSNARLNAKADLNCNLDLCAKG